MRKFLFIVGVAALVLNSEGMTIEAYRHHSQKFTKETDLVRGYILTESGILQRTRVSGNISYYYEKGKVYDGRSCSYRDKGLDPVSDLIVQLFPSAGLFNAQGSHSLSVKFKKYHTDLIAGMFKIAHETRKDILRHPGQQASDNSILRMLQSIEPEIKEIEISDKTKQISENVISYINGFFNIKEDYSKYCGQLFRLGKNIAESVVLERQDNIEEGSVIDFSFKEKYPYPPFYTNDLICAYAWNACSSDDIVTLAEKIKLKLGYSQSGESCDQRHENRDIGFSNYKSLLTEIIFKMNSFSSVVPFRPGQHIITNSVAKYKKHSFPDCVETSIRQFLSCLFCSAEFGENGRPTGKLITELDRIPMKAEKLRDFFAPNGKVVDIRELANDGSQKIRNKWASIVSGHQYIKQNGIDVDFISYNKNGFELMGGWVNAIKVICYLLDGYSAKQDGESTPRKVAAERRIKQINDDAKSHTLTLSANEVLETINDILGIRSDLDMVAEASSSRNLETNKNEIEGNILIYPKEYKEGNVIEIYNQIRHSYLSSAPFISVNYEFKPSSWIEGLFKDKYMAICGRSIENVFRNQIELYDATYPILSFYIGIGQNRMYDIMKSKYPHIQAVAREYFSFDASFDLNNFLKGLESRNVLPAYVSEIVNLICEYSENDINKHICALYSKDDLSKQKMINTEMSYDELIKQRMVNKRFNETDCVIEEKIKTMNVFDTYNFLCDIYDYYNVCDCLDIPVFSKDMSNTFFQFVERFENECDREGFAKEEMVKSSLMFLDLLDFYETTPYIDNFIELAKLCKKEDVLLIMGMNISRSQRKLELLLPFSHITKESVSDRVFDEYNGMFSSEVASGIIFTISSEKVPLVMSRLSETSLSSVVDGIFSKYFLCRDVYDKQRVSQILMLLKDRFGKFDLELSKKLVDMMPQHLKMSVVLCSQDPLELMDYMTE